LVSVHGSSEERAIQKLLPVPEPSSVLHEVSFLCPFLYRLSLPVLFACHLLLLQSYSRATAIFREGYSRLDPALLAPGCAKQLHNL